MLLSENDGEGTVRHQDMVAKGVLPGKNKQTKWCLVALLLCVALLFCFVDFLSVLFIVLYFLFFLTTHFFFSFFFFLFSFFLFSFYSVDTIFKR